MTELNSHNSRKANNGLRLAPLLVDDPEAQRLLGGVCAKTLYNMRQKGLPFIRVGGRVMYSPDDLAAWVAQLREGR